MTIKTNQCEGFNSDLFSPLSTPMFEQNTEQKGNDVISTPSTQTIRSFLSSSNNLSSPSSSLPSSKGVLERWEETQWFFSLLEDISQYFPIDQIHSKKIQLQFLNQLALIWYNFDSLSTARSRPFKSYRRLKKDIEILTWIVIKETKQFIETNTNISSSLSPPLENNDYNNDHEEELSQLYKELLKRLNIS